MQCQVDTSISNHSTLSIVDLDTDLARRQNTYLSGETSAAVITYVKVISWQYSEKNKQTNKLTHLPKSVFKILSPVVFPFPAKLPFNRLQNLLRRHFVFTRDYFRLLKTQKRVTRPQFPRIRQ